MEGDNEGVKMAESGSGAGTGVLSFDARLISEFDGSADVVEWFSRTELLCEHRGVSVASVLPLRLTGGAFSVWSQLPPASRGCVSAVREALYAAFALDQHAAYEAFTHRDLRIGESADVYLADLRRLSTLFGGVPDRTLVCAFIAGLPDSVRQVIRAGSRAEGLSLDDVLTRARAVLSDERFSVAAAASRGRTLQREQQPARRHQSRGEASHVTSTQQQQRRGARGPPRCWVCGEIGHISLVCSRRPGNSLGEGVSAPASSPVQSQVAPYQ